MKTKLKAITRLIPLILLAGCAGPPGSSWAERKLYNVETNYVPHVIVQTVTNFVPVIVERTNTVAVTNLGVVTFQTNVFNVTNITELVQQFTQTNIVPVTSLVDKPAAVETIRTVGGIAGGYAGIGGLLSTALVGAYGVYRRFRNRKVQEALIQAIETGREILGNTPQGQELFERYTTWLQTHQRTAGVLGDVRKLVETFADNEAAQRAAKLLLPQAPSGAATTAPRLV